jgi:hypothetical protein
MAKAKDKVALKKGESRFVLVGTANIGDYTFTIDAESANSPWQYSSARLGVDCGDDGLIFAEMMGGFSTKPTAENVVYVHGKKLDDNGKEVDDYQSRFTIDWDDRLNENFTDEVGNQCFITIGVEKDANDKTFYKKFLSEYDAVSYLKEHLTGGETIRVQGKLEYSEYEGRTQVKKKITSVALSSATPDKFGATFSQSILVDKDSVGKLDKDKNTYPITAFVVEYVGKPKVNGKKVEIKENAVFPRVFEVVHADDEKTPKLLKMMFGAKKDEAWEVIAEGRITKGANTVQMTFDDLPDDVKELVEYGALTEEDALATCIGKGGKTETFIIEKPRIKRVEKDGEAKITVEINKDKYTTDDYVFFAQLLSKAGVETEKEEPEEDEEIDMDALLGELEDDDLPF